MTSRQYAAAAFSGRGPHAMQGAIAASRLIAIAVIVVILAIGAWWFLARKPGAPLVPGAAPSSTAPAA